MARSHAPKPLSLGLAALIAGCGVGTGRAGLGSVDPKLEGTYEARLTDTPQEVLMVTEMKPDGAYRQTSTIDVPEGTVVVTLLGTYSTKGDQFRMEPTSLTPEYNVPDKARVRIASRVAPVIWALRAMSKGERDYTYTVDDAAFVVTDWNGNTVKWLRTKGKGGLPVVAPPPPKAAPVIPPVTAPYREPSPPPAPSGGGTAGGYPGGGYPNGGNPADEATAGTQRTEATRRPIPRAAPRAAPKRPLRVATGTRAERAGAAPARARREIRTAGRTAGTSAARGGRPRRPDPCSRGRSSSA